MSDFWIPKHKYQLVDALSKMYPEDASKFRAMKKDRLYAIYLNARKSEGKRAVVKPQEEPSHVSKG